jgi:5-methylcytosine-specific restriction endonuclease McrA
VRRCNKCGIEKPLEDFHRDKRLKEGRRFDCKACKKEKWATYREANRERLRESRRAWRVSLFAETVTTYNNECARCGESDLEVLTVDHVAEDGASHRAELGRGETLTLLVWAKRNGWPDRLQILCANCHLRKSRAALRAKRLS